MHIHFTHGPQGVGMRDEVECRDEQGVKIEAGLNKYKVSTIHTIPLVAAKLAPSPPAELCPWHCSTLWIVSRCYFWQCAQN